jgi:hypothetical protein
VKEIEAEDIDYKRAKMILEENAKGSKISRAVFLLTIGSDAPMRQPGKVRNGSS